MPIIQMTTDQLMKALFRVAVKKDNEQRVCFIIGAGASVQSNIPSGGRLAKRWWDELLSIPIFPRAQIDEWLLEDEPNTVSAKKMDLYNLRQTKPDLSEHDLAPYYGKIYAFRFLMNPDEGIEELTKSMSAIEPSYGYTVLAQMLAQGRHNVVITTNFDNLIEYSLHIYTNSHPLMCGHETMASFAKSSQNRPLIAKIHRDLYMNPLNEEEDLKQLKKAWIEPLKALLTDRKIIVLGYGGNDGSLMSLLNELPLNKNLYWCNRKKSVLQPNVQKLLEDKNGYEVSIDGFDEFMFMLRSTMEFERLDTKIEADGKRRADNYRNKEKEIIDERNKSTDPAVMEAVKERLEEAQGEDDDFSYLLKSLDISDPKEGMEFLKKGLAKYPDSAYINGQIAYLMQFKLNLKDEKIETYYKKALEADPNNAVYLGNYAIFLHIIRKDYDVAEVYYKKALEADPNNAVGLGNYAMFLHIIRKNYDAAEVYYKKAFEADPNNTHNLSNYAIFLKDIRIDYDAAEAYYNKALEADPNSADNIGNYANFLHTIRKDYDTAEVYYKKALQADPNNVINLGSFANFLNNIRKDHNAAEVYYKKALEADPGNAINLGKYAIFLSDIRKDYNEAEVYYKKALEADPGNANNIGNYAVFLNDIRKDYNAAEVYYKRALEADPSNAGCLGNYAIFLKDIRFDYDTSEVYYRKALEADPDMANTLNNYAIFLYTIRDDYDAADVYYKKALGADPNNTNHLSNYANFLKNIRKDYDAAEVYHKKALEADPNHSNSLGNYSQFLLSKGRKDEATPLLIRAFENCEDEKSLLLELWFYRYAHYPAYMEEAKQHIEALLAEGIRSPGWDLQPNIDRAIADGHPDQAELKRLAVAISSANAGEVS